MCCNLGLLHPTWLQFSPLKHLNLSCSLTSTPLHLPGSRYSQFQVLVSQQLFVKAFHRNALTSSRPVDRKETPAFPDLPAIYFTWAPSAKPSCQSPPARVAQPNVSHTTYPEPCCSLDQCNILSSTSVKPFKLRLSMSESVVGPCGARRYTHL